MALVYMENQLEWTASVLLLPLPQARSTFEAGPCPIILAVCAPT
jgi:hypothetical protein